MDLASFEILQTIKQRFSIEGPVLNFGSRIAHGQGKLDAHKIFPEMVGCDYINGTGVDLVADIRSIPLPDRESQITICVNTLEHVKNSEAAMAELVRVSGELLFIQIPFSFPLHGHPHDYVRFTPQTMWDGLNEFKYLQVSTMGWPHNPRYVIGVGVRSAEYREEFLGFCEDLNRHCRKYFLPCGWWSPRSWIPFLLPEAVVGLIRLMQFGGGRECRRPTTRCD